MNSFDNRNQEFIDDLPSFKKEIESLVNLNLDRYKDHQVERRIKLFMNKFKINSYLELSIKLKNDDVLLEKFIDSLTINVTEFFRDKDKFEELEQNYLIELNKLANGNIKIWSAGCAKGFEAFSVAMLLEDNGLLDSCYLLATDFDVKSIDIAQKGIFKINEMETLPAKYYKYFKKIEPDKYKISQKLVDKIIFKRHNLLEDKYEDAFHLILCRNVLIYLNQDSQYFLYRSFNKSLVKGGILFLGSSEKILNSEDFGFTTMSKLFYKKKN